jgi:hypothetical protein
VDEDIRIIVCFGLIISRPYQNGLVFFCFG